MEWRKNLYHYEAQPPEQVWNLVAEELKDDAPASLRDKLFEMEAQPPATVWDDLSEELHGGSTTPLIWYRQPWKVAAAAALVAIISGTYYFNRDTVGAEMATTAIVKPATVPQPQPAPMVTPVPAEQAKPTQALASIHPGQSSSTASPITPAPSAAKKIRRPKASDHNYIYFTSRNGENKRLSYKLEKLLPVIRNNRKEGMVKEWTSALERSAFVPSGNNFFDIVEMVKLVEEQQD